MVTLFGGGVEACHLFNILETPYMSNVVCSHRMIYHNGNTDEDAPHNQDGAYNKYCMDQMWGWMRPSFKKEALLNFYAENPAEMNDSLLVKKAFQAVFMSKIVEPVRSSADVTYKDRERMEQFFDLSHERFLNIKKPVDIQMADPSPSSEEIAVSRLRQLTYSELNTQTDPWPQITSDINSNIKDGRYITVNECHSIYQTMDNINSLFIDNA